jgi:hypothetical protein
MPLTTVGMDAYLNGAEQLENRMEELMLAALGADFNSSLPCLT